MLRLDRNEPVHSELEMHTMQLNKLLHIILETFVYVNISLTQQKNNPYLLLIEQVYRLSEDAMI